MAQQCGVVAAQQWYREMREFSVRDLDGHIPRIGHGERTVQEIEQFRTEAETWT